MTIDAYRKFYLLGYRSLIQTFIEAGYVSRLFNDLDQNKSHVVLRHDIDFSLKAAVDIARIEAELGVRSHFYVLLRTEFYNIFLPKDWENVCTLAELGHNVVSILMPHYMISKRTY